MDISEVSRSKLELALEDLVKLQAHYAKLLNQYDGGRRHAFTSAEDWLNRWLNPQPGRSQ